MAVIPGAKKVGLNQAGMGERKIAVGQYDFAVEGGVVGDITLRGDTIPSGARVVEAFIDTTTVLTSAGAASVAIKVEGAADTNSADLISGAPWSTIDVFRADALEGVDKGFKPSAARSIVATVAVADLTAGVFKVIVEYYEVA